MATRLTLENPILTPRQLLAPPSRVHGISTELELELRSLGCELVQAAGQLLRLPQMALATAQVLLHRFYFRQSLRTFGVQEVAMSATFVASKIEEHPRRIRDIANVFHYLVRKRKGLPEDSLDYFSEEFYEMKNSIITVELHILKELGFNVHVQHPHGLLVNYLKVLDLTSNQDFVQTAWSYLNDSFRTFAMVCYQPHSVACAVIWLSARLFGIKLPQSPPWWELFDAEEADLINITCLILDICSRELSNDLPLTAAETEKYLTIKPSDSQNPSVKGDAMDTINTPVVVEQAPKPPAKVIDIEALKASIKSLTAAASSKLQSSSSSSSSSSSTTSITSASVSRSKSSLEELPMSEAPSKESASLRRSLMQHSEAASSGTISSSNTMEAESKSSLLELHKSNSFNRNERDDVGQARNPKRSRFDIDSSMERKSTNSSSDSSGILSSTLSSSSSSVTSSLSSSSSSTTVASASVLASVLESINEPPSRSSSGDTKSRTSSSRSSSEKDGANSNSGSDIWSRVKFMRS